MQSWVFVPGALFYLAGVGLTLFGAFRGSRPAVLAAIRMRFLGLGLLLFLPGIVLTIQGVMGGLQLWTVFAGLVLIGFGGLWLYARGGIGPNFPNV